MSKDKNRIGRHYVCMGVGSEVIQENLEAKGPFDLERRNPHVIQLDVDDLEKHPRDTIIFDDLPDGIYLVTRTDTASWNITSLTCYDWQTVIEAKASISVDDAQHLKIGIQRGYWIMRLSAKGDRTRPEFAGLVHNYDRSISDRQKELMTLSKPHVELYSALYSEYDVYSMLPALPTCGDGLKKEKYTTRVD